MNDDIVLLTYDEAVALLPEGGTVHTLLDTGTGCLVGADWSREQVLDLLRAGRREVTGPAAQAMDHGLAAFRDGAPVFIETARTESGG